MIPWISISVVIGLIVVGLAIIFAVRNKGKKVEPDYRTFFILGITWLPLGIATDNNAFLFMGIVFMVLGLVNKDKWNKEKKFSELSKKEQKTRIILITVAGLLVLLGLVTYFLTKNAVG